MLVTLAGLLLGLLQGVRHAFEPDHLAAVSTLVADRRTARSPLLIGAAWGLGHTLMLLVVGVVVLALRARIPAMVEEVCELLVAAMLIALGARALVRAFKDGRQGPHTLHAHGAGTHAHSGAREHVHVRSWTIARRPLLIGLVHGLAGSGALTALVFAQLSSDAARVAFMLLFGVGSTIGMAVLTGLLGWPLARAMKHPRALPALLGATGLVSLVVGVAWGAPIASRLLG
jgi:ABC-type nickel/cobalt efflux system permease component RcnA